MDPRLLAIIEAAEAGAPVPEVSLIAGGWLIQGHPVSDAEFIAASQRNLNSQVMAATPQRDLKRFRGKDAELDAVVGLRPIPSSLRWSPWQ